MPPTHFLCTRYCDNYCMHVFSLSKKKIQLILNQPPRAWACTIIRILQKNEMRRTRLKVTQQGKSGDLNPGLGPAQCRLPATALPELPTKFWGHGGQLLFSLLLLLPLLPRPSWLLIIMSDFWAMIEMAEVVLKSSDRQGELEILIPRQYYTK